MAVIGQPGAQLGSRSVGRFVRTCFQRRSLFFFSTGAERDRTEAGRRDKAIWWSYDSAEASSCYLKPTPTLYSNTYSSHYLRDAGRVLNYAAAAAAPRRRTRPRPRLATKPNENSAHLFGGKTRAVRSVSRHKTPARYKTATEYGRGRTLTFLAVHFVSSERVRKKSITPGLISCNCRSLSLSPSFALSEVNEEKESLLASWS